MEHFSERVYQLRKEEGFTQEELATKLKVSRQTISNWENKTAQPTIDKAVELANMFDMSMDELIGKQKEKVKEISKVLLSLVNQSATLYIDPNTDASLSFKKIKIKNCEIIEVNPNTVRVIIIKKKQAIEKVIFLKDILGFELEVE